MFLCALGSGLWARGQQPCPSTWGSQMQFENPIVWFPFFPSQDLTCHCPIDRCVRCFWTSGKGPMRLKRSLGRSNIMDMIFEARGRDVQLKSSGTDAVCHDHTTPPQFGGSNPGGGGGGAAGPGPCMRHPQPPPPAPRVVKDSSAGAMAPTAPNFLSHA